jgi:hypothetical protein
MSLQAFAQFELPALEQHFTVQQVAEAWGLSEASIRRMFGEQPGVLRKAAPTVTGKRRRVLLRIPASVVARVHDDLECLPTLGKVQPLRRGVK